MAETRQSVHVEQSNSSVFKVRLKVLRSSANRHLYDSEFQTEGALTVTVNAFADNAIFGTNSISNNLSDERMHYMHSRFQ